jgi:hypothetical protein
MLANSATIPIGDLVRRGRTGNGIGRDGVSKCITRIFRNHILCNYLRNHARIYWFGEDSENSEKRANGCYFGTTDLIAGFPKITTKRRM